MKRLLFFLLFIICVKLGWGENTSFSNAIMLNLRAGTIFGAGGVGFNFDQGFEYQFFLGNKLPWGFEINYHTVFGGWGFCVKTGPMFIINGSGLSGVFFQTYFGFKGEMITGLNWLGDFFVPILELDGIFAYQFANQGGFFASFGAGPNLVIVLDAGPLGGGGVGIGVKGAIRVGYAF
ncbi:MAG: hypothetical protein ACP5Q5_00575 [Brevinematia bacterium]